MITPENFPVVGAVFEFGAQDRVLDSFLLLGPLVVLAFVVFGRSALTVLIVSLYVLSFLGYVLYNGVHSAE